MATAALLLLFCPLTATPSRRPVLHSVVEQGDVAAVQRTLAADGHASLVNTPDTRAQHFW